MADNGFSRTCLLLVFSVCVLVVSGSPIGTSVLNCVSGSTLVVGSVDEGYTGDIEVVTGINPSSNVKLVDYIFPKHLEFLELRFTLGDTNATVHTKKQLDAEALKDTDRTLYYAVMCDSGHKLNNSRTLLVNDLNDNSPIFPQEHYSTTVSEAEPLDFQVIQVRAEDNDSSSENSRLTYSITPTSDDFMVTNEGAFILKRRLNYNVAPSYTFILTARDVGGLSDSTSVVIYVQDFDNLNPYFSHSIYRASIAENQVGLFRFIEPEAIRAQDGDTGINVTVSYTISAVSPDQYERNFNIHPSTGVISVLTAIDREEMDGDLISVSIKAAQTDDPLKTADAVVSVTVEDVNDNPPEFDQPNYSVTLLENSPVNTVVLKATVTDLDQGGFVGTLRILPESSPFSIDPDGTVRVKNSTVLDRETTEGIMFKIEARESSEPNSVVEAQVSVTLLDENDNSPVFTSKTYAGKVFANQTEGMLLVQVHADDPDAGENARVTYSIDFGNNDGYFSLEENTGEITLAKTIPLVENRILEFPLYITATDGGVIPRSTPAQVNIRAPGESKPQFLHKVYRGTIEEEKDPGVLILRVNFLDLSPEHPATLSVDTEEDKFAISPNGELTSRVKLDYDDAPHNYSVMISISDGVNSDTATMEVEVTDINDNSPVFSSSSVTASVPENAEVGSNVTAVPATDKDSGFNQEIRYWLRGGEGSFSVHPLSGMVSVAAGLDRETKAEYNLLLVAEDQGRPARSATASLLLRVSDVNDNAPVFSQAQYQVEVLETESVGTSLLNITAEDADEGANRRVVYRIVQQSPSSEAPVFELDSSSGTLLLAGPLDYSEVKTYSLIVQASDGGTPSLVGNGSVVVKVKDVNNNPPEFSKESYDVAVPENLANGASILTLEVSDRDEGGFKGTLRILPESSPFSISSDGTISVTNTTALDRETTERITFQVEAREADPPNHVATASVNVTLLDENDNSPKFTSSKYESKIFTNQTEGMLLVKVEAEDPDSGVNGQVKYSIDFGNQHNYFSIDEISGEITLRAEIPLRAHDRQEFLLFITARDGGVVSRSDSSQVEIQALGETKPYFTQRTFRGTIEEEREPGTNIVKVDFLATEEVAVTLSVDTEEDKFAISPNGELTSKVKLDYDDAPHNYSVMISISDGVNSDTATVEVEVTDINDNSPVFSSSSVTASVPEDAEVGSNVTAVPATDKDSGFNQEIRYWLRGGEGSFSVHPLSGMVSVAAGLDRETKAEYNLLLVAEDQGRPARSATASLLLRVSDVNDNAPVFSQAQYQVEVLETESVGRSLLNITAEDADEGANGRVVYRIVQQSPSSEAPAFELDSSSGTLLLAGPLDYSEVKMYSLIVQASDGGTPSLVGNGSVVVKVKDVNNNPPEFSKESYDVAVPENLANGASILTLEVSDRDEGGFKGTLRILPESSPFSISSDGTISVTNTTALDRETTERITFQVEAREADPPNHVATASVNVTLLDENDNSPKFTSSKYESKIFTNQTEGMLLVKVEAEDPDSGVNGQVKYSIDFGNQHNYFSIDEISGEITLRAEIPLRAHDRQEFLLFITARDGGVVSRSDSSQVEIQALGETKPYFTQRTFRGTIEEEREPGTNIVKVDFLATEEVAVTLSVDTEEDKFAISPNGELTSKVKLDYDDAPHNYSVMISISDGVNSDTATVEVEVTDINDNSPVFSSSSVTASVPEDAEVGSNVTAVPATDKDSGFNQEIRYWLRGGEGSFSVHPLSGMVSVAAGLDRETKAEYNLLLVAEDQGRPARSATASLLLRVSDVNDNAPVFSQAQYQVEVLETESVGMSLLNITAEDADEGANRRVVYRIVQQSPSSEAPVFELDSSSGTLLLAGPLDYSEVKMYSLIVQASDGGTPSLVGNGSVVVNVKDVNNNPPEFSKESYDVAVPENLANGASILTLEVSDRDEGGFANGYFMYSSDTFEINKQGVVSLRKNVSLDRETKDSYILQVRAVDQPSAGLTSTAQLNITVLDYNDNTPQFPSIPEPLQIPEGDYSEASPGEVFTFVPTDADVGLNGEVTVSLASPHPLFRIREDGTLLAVGLLDRESRETYELLVRASDKGSPQRENVTSIRVNLLDVNDNRPEFSSSSYVHSLLLKDAEEGKLLLTLSATDRDAGNNSLISYSFSAGSSPYLALNSVTGAVTLTSDLADVTEDTTLVLTAMAEDHGRPPLNSTARVVVNLRVVNLVEGVAFQSSSYNFSLPENEPAGATVGDVWASSGSDLYKVSYALKTHTDLFSIDQGGAIVTRAQLDREQQEWYILDVEAVDTRTPPTTAVALVRVQVEDVNEPPVFPSEEYKASVFSIAPFKTPVITVKASDPDVGEEGRLAYSLSGDSPYFDVDPSTGLVYVVSVVSLAGESASVQVKATDPRGLQATTEVEVAVQGSASSSDVVVISLNQPANTVERKVPDLEKSLGSVLDWTVNIIEVSSSNGGSSESRAVREEMNTLVSFISVDEDRVVSSEDVIEKLQSRSTAVKEKLSEVFGDELDFDVELDSPTEGSDQAVVIALAVLFALSMLGLSIAMGFIIWIRVTEKKDRSSDKESFDIGRHAEGYTNWPQMIPEPSELGDTTRAEDQRQKMDSETGGTGGTAERDGDDEPVKTDSSGVKLTPTKETDDTDSDEDERGSSSL